MIQEKEITICDLRINYKEAGEESSLLNSLPAGQTGNRQVIPLLILHGWGGFSGSWEGVSKILALKGVRVIIPDLPGFGKSQTPRSAWGVREYSDFLLNLATSLKLKEFFLLGHSFGGRISIKFAVFHPEKIRKLILCDSAGIKEQYGPKEKFIYYLVKIGNAVFTPEPLARLKDAARSFFFLFIRHKDYAKAKGMMKEVIKKVLDEDLLADLPQIKNETLIIWGGRDKLVPVKYAAVFKEKIANSQLKIIPPSGHSPHLEFPNELSEIIWQFLQQGSNREQPAT